MRTLRAILILFLVAIVCYGCTYSEFAESWKGPSVKTNKACEPQMGTGYRVGSKEFVPIGKWEWTDIDGVKHVEDVYVMWDLSNRKAGGK